MKKRNQEKEIKELEELKLFTTQVKCGTFYSVPRVIDFYEKHYLPLLEKVKKYEEGNKFI